MVIYLLSIMPSTWQGNYLSIYTRCKTGMLPVIVGNKQEETASELIKEIVLARWGDQAAQ